jgi:2-amino-4-hydroxy-6-hydroxymethyldihydropteridine diphosphokinase
VNGAVEDPQPVCAFLGLGSNLGDRMANLQRAIDLLAGRPGIQVLRSSRVYETDPVGGPAQPPYLNAVVEVATRLSPQELLEVCLAVERRLGRVRGERWGPRTIDIDLLTYGREELNEPSLTVPHPRMHERAFVLVPLLELAPDPPLPGGRSMASLRLATSALAGVEPYAPPLSVRASTR